MKFIYIVLFILLSSQLLCDETNKIEEGSSLGYKNSFGYFESTSFNLNINFGIKLNKDIDVEYGGVQLNWLADDPYNKKKKNFSAASIHNIFAIVLLSPIPQKNAKIYNIVSPLVSNSYVHYHPEFSKFENLKFSFFFKNIYNLYFLRRKVWLEMSPGIGVTTELYNSGTYVDIGIQHKVHFVPARKTIRRNTLFLRIHMDYYWF